MKLIKLVLISAVVLFVLITALSLLLPSHVRISRAININGSRELIQPYIGDLREWKKWNRFVIIADSMKEIEVLLSERVQAKKLQVSLIRNDADTIEAIWRQPGGKASIGGFALLPGEHYTVVQWYFDFYLDWYPWQKFQSIIYDKQLGIPMENSLQQLKQIIETSQ